MTTPNLLAAPTAEITVTGTAIAIAHGDAATNTTNARCVHVAGSPTRNPNNTISSDATSTAGTRGRATRSANRARSPFADWACSTRRTICVNELSRPSDVARIRSVPEPFTEPAETLLPGQTPTGMDSPVIADVSNHDCPAITVPSVATRSPAPTTSTSDTRTSDAGTVVSASLRTTRAVFGMSDNSARRPCWARSMARSSRVSEIEKRNARAAASPTCPNSTAPMAAMVMSKPTPIRDRPLPTTSCRREPGMNVHPPAMSATQ